MNITLNVEIHFHEQEVASIFLESSGGGDDEKMGEICLFSLFAIRQMSNLGAVEESDQLAMVLVGLADNVQRLVDGQASGGLKLIPYPGRHGRRRFLAQLHFADKPFLIGTRFDVQAKGFGWLARGAGYYAPVAVLGLLTYLAMKRPTDVEFLESLSRGAALCGTFQLGRQISVTNHPQLGLAVLTNTCTKYLSQ